MDKVVLVNTKDQEIGQMEKLEAHRKGVLHRAFSILIHNSKGELLLQKRANNKYHSGGLWTNTCCSHPKPGETTQGAAKRRLFEEMGINITPEYAYKFIYKTTFDNGLTEHEYDHVFIAKYDGEPNINPDEASSWKFMSIAAIKSDIQQNRDHYTVWFKFIMASFEQNISTLN